MKLFLFLIIGLVLGRSGLDWTLPAHASMIQLIAACGFLFVAGLELSFKKIRKQLKPAAVLAVGSFGVPFCLGLLSTIWLMPTSSWNVAYFFAIALAVSALPVIIQFLQEMKLYDQPIGRLIVATATICDILAWVGFTVVLEREAQGSWFGSHLPVICFFAGLFTSDFAPISSRTKEMLLTVSRYTFAPIFFIGIGWKIYLQEHLDWKQAFVILLLATIGKLLGTYMAAAPLKLKEQERCLVSLSLNARGAMEILLAATALQQGLIDETLFTSLVAMALATSLLLGPLALAAATRTRKQQALH